MNMRDVELRTGLERANIRYYEKEGLVAPQRQSNGYRDYLDEDVEILLRIKLLRQLNISVAEIKRLQADEVALHEVLRQRLVRMQQERAQLAREEKVCKTIQSDGVEYSQLEAQRYLKQLQELKNTGWGMNQGGGMDVATWNLSQDVLPPDLRPGQRFLARIMEWTAYTVLWLFLYYQVLRTPFAWEKAVLWLHMFMSLVLWILLEPLQMMCFGTTIGKAIIGMQVYTMYGRKLDWSNAWARLWKVVSLGACISHWNRYWSRMRYGDYWPYNKDKGFPWDEEYPYSFRDEKPWRWPAVVACTIGLVLVGGLIVADAQGMDHTGPKTVAEFAENYNKYVRLHGGAEEYSLNELGYWERISDGSFYVYADNGEGSHETRFPKFVYTKKEGYLVGISFEIHREEEGEQWISTAKPSMIAAAVAYAAGHGKGQSTAAIEAEIEQYHLQDHAFQVGDLTVSWQVDVSGYVYQDGLDALIPLEHANGQEYSYHLIFEIKPTEQRGAN